MSEEVGGGGRRLSASDRTSSHRRKWFPTSAPRVTTPPVLIRLIDKKTQTTEAGRIITLVWPALYFLPDRWVSHPWTQTPRGDITLYKLYCTVQHCTAHTGHNLGAEIPPQWLAMTWPQVTALLCSPGNSGHREQLSLGTIIIILTHGSAHYVHSMDIERKYFQFHSRQFHKQFLVEIWKANIWYIYMLIFFIC